MEPASAGATALLVVALVLIVVVGILLGAGALFGVICAGALAMYVVGRKLR